MERKDLLQTAEYLLSLDPGLFVRLRLQRGILGAVQLDNAAPIIV